LSDLRNSRELHDKDRIPDSLELKTFHGLAIEFTDEEVKNE
jgi:hypothetical protein